VRDDPEDDFDMQEPKVRRKRNGAQKGGRPRRKRTEVFPELRWGSPQACRETLARLATGFSEGTVTEGQLRILTYAARALLPFFEFERGLPLATRMQAIEDALDDLRKPGGRS
jgi:hypothetical protein